ncbi:MAG: MopE-related protein, partial [Thermodesulfobacteriota bacterium]
NVCAQPVGYVLDDTDCNDSDDTVSPTAVEICDGLINTCGGSLPLVEIDNDSDGYVECTIDGGGWDTLPLLLGDDCNDAAVATYPGATDAPGDDLDQNCDDTVVCFNDGDQDGYGALSSAESGYAAAGGFGAAGACGSTTGDLWADNSTDCNDADATENPAVIWYADGDLDTYGDPASSNVCSRAAGTDVTDNLDNCPAVANPDQTDSNYNGIGDACDQADTDGDGIRDQDDTEPLIPNDDSPLLSGEYHAAEFMDDYVSADGQFFSSRASLFFNGTDVEGLYTEEATTCQEAEPQNCPALESGPFFYNLENDYSFTIFGDTVLGNVSMDPGNDVFLINDAEVDPDDSLMLMIGARKGAGMDKFALAGEYIITQITDTQVSQTDPGLAMFTQRFGATFEPDNITFAPAGAWYYATLADMPWDCDEVGKCFQSSTDERYSSTLDEVANPNPDPAEYIPYSVSADGRFMIGATDLGFVSPDGELMVIIDTAADPLPTPIDDTITLSVGVRYAGAGGSMDNSSIQGEFAYHEMKYDDLATPSTQNTYAWLTFDGQTPGTGNFKIIADSTGGSGEMTFTYEVTPGGQFLIETTPADVDNFPFGNFPEIEDVDHNGDTILDLAVYDLKGIVSANGDYIVAGDVDWLNADPGLSFGVGIRKPLSQVAAPGSITVPATSATGDYTISWTASSTSEVSYELQEATQSDFSDAALVYESDFGVDGEVLSYDVIGQTAGVYYYRVLAKKVGMTSSGWVFGANEIDVLRTDAPDWLSVPATASGNSIQIFWDPSTTPGVSYLVEIDTDPAFSSPTEAYNGTATSIYAPVATGSGSYYFRVKSRKAGMGDSFYKSSPTGCVFTEMPVVAGTSFLSVPATASGNRIPVFWGASATPGVTYIVQMDNAPGFPSPTEVYNGPNTSVNALVTTGSDTYYFKVKARKAGLADSKYRTSSTGCVFTEAPVAAGTSFLSVPATASGNRIAVFWGASATPGVTYIVQMDNDPAFPSPTEVYNGLNTSVNALVTTGSDTYYFKVKARKAGLVDSLYRTSPTGCVFTEAPVAAGTSFLSVPATATGNRIPVFWGASATSGVTYIVQMDNDPAFPSPTEVYNGLNTSVNALVTTGSDTYYFKVKARKAGLVDSLYRTSPTGCVFTEAPVAAGTSFLSVPATASGTSVTISWGASATPDVNYILVMDTDPAFTSPVEVYNNTATSTDVAIGISGTYYFKVKARKTGLVDSLYRSVPTGCVFTFVP